VTKPKTGDCFFLKNDKRKYQIVAILNEPQIQIVYKYFGINKKWWHYEIISFRQFILNFSLGFCKATSQKDDTIEHQ
jgi:hypothetical protein